MERNCKFDFIQEKHEKNCKSNFYLRETQRKFADLKS